MVSCAVMCYCITKDNSSTCCTGSCCYRQLEIVLVSEDGWRMFSEKMRRSAANPQTGRTSEHRRGFEPEVSVWIHQTCSSDPVQFLSFLSAFPPVSLCLPDSRPSLRHFWRGFSKQQKVMSQVLSQVFQILFPRVFRPHTSSSSIQLPQVFKHTLRYAVFS